MERPHHRAAPQWRGRRDRDGLLTFFLAGMALAVLAMAVVSRDRVLSRGADALDTGRASQPGPGLALRAGAPAPVALSAPVPRSTTAPSVPLQKVAPPAHPPTPPIQTRLDSNLLTGSIARPFPHPRISLQPRLLKLPSLERRLRTSSAFSTRASSGRKPTPTKSLP